MKAITEVKNKSDIVFAHTLDGHIKILKTKIAEHIIMLGEFFKQMRDGKLYCYLDCESFNEYVARPDIGFKRSSVYDFIHFHELYVEELGIEPHLLSSIGHGRLSILAPVVREDPEEWLSKAETLSTSDLINEVREARGKPPMKPKTEGATDSLDIVANYLEFLKCQPCCVCGAKYVEVAHYPRTRGAGAKDDEAIPLCSACHRFSHDYGFVSYFELYGKQIFTNFIYPTFRRLFNERRPGKVSMDSVRDGNRSPATDIPFSDSSSEHEGGATDTDMVVDTVGEK